MPGYRVKTVKAGFSLGRHNDATPVSLTVLTRLQEVTAPSPQECNSRKIPLSVCGWISRHKAAIFH